MKNKFSKNNTKNVHMGCNEWCCPCNEGKGCQANDAFMMLCEMSSFDRNDNEYNKLMNEAYWAMQESFTGDSSHYNEVCEKLYKLSEVYN